MNTIQRAAAVVAVALTLTFAGTAANAEPAVVHADTYAQAYTECAAQGWDPGTVNACRWAAAIHFGGQHDQYYYLHHTTTDA